MSKLRWLALLAALGAAAGIGLLVVDRSPEREVSVGQSPTTTSTVGGPTTTSTSGPTTTTTTGNPAIRTVTHRGLRVDVPSAWPVHDLAASPRQCVRYDQHAVFVGTQGADPDCPSRLVGRTETVQIQALGANTKLTEALATQSSTLNGLAVRVDPNAEASGALTVVVPDLQVAVTITFGTDRPLAEQILRTTRAA